MVLNREALQQSIGKCESYIKADSHNPLLWVALVSPGGKTYYYNHSYFGDGREKNIVAFGDAFGNSTSTYDTNNARSSVNLGQGDGQNRPEVKTFASDLADAFAFLGRIAECAGDR